MGIKPNFTKEDVAKRFEIFLKYIEEEQIKLLQYLGEQCVIHARTIPSETGFTDQTGNLRSSIGYVVLKNGVAVKSDYEQVNGPKGNGSEGLKAGKALAEKAAEKYPTGIVLVVTAGMNYAVYVESKGRDVLTSAELIAKQELPRLLNDLLADINGL